MEHCRIKGRGALDACEEFVGQGYVRPDSLARKPDNANEQEFGLNGFSYTDIVETESNPRKSIRHSLLF